MEAHMRILKTAALAALGGAMLLAGCATGPYYDNGYYGGAYGYNPAYGYDTPYYYEPGYVGPSVGLGLGYSYYDGDGRNWHDNDRRWSNGRGDNNWRGRDNDGRSRGNDARGDRGDRNHDGIRDNWTDRQSAGQQDRGGRPEPNEQHDQRG
jgi:hypothetical protein